MVAVNIEAEHGAVPITTATVTAAKSAANPTVAAPFVRWKDEVIRTAWALLFFLLVALLMSMVQVIGDERSIRTSMQNAKMSPQNPNTYGMMTGVEYHRLVPLNSMDGPLPDLAIEVLPHPRGFPKWMADITLNSFVVSSILFGLLGQVVMRAGKTDTLLSGTKRAAIILVYARRVIWLFGICYGFRAFSLFGTTLPSSNPACHLVKRSGWEWLTTGPKILVGAAQTCTDKLFSGHTCLAMLLFWTWFLACGVHGSTSTSGLFRLRRILYITYAALHSSAVWICSLICRHHYTVDIVLAMIVSSLVFHTYHLLLWILQSQMAQRYAGYGEVWRPFIGHGGDLEYLGGSAAVLMTAKYNDSNSDEENNNHQLESVVYHRPYPRVNNAVFLAPPHRHPLHWALLTVAWMDGIDLRAAKGR